jgi:hypothetical protein
MIFLKKPIIFLALVLMAFPRTGVAQYLFQVEPLFNYLSDLKRYEISGNYNLPFATFNGVTRAVGPNNNFLGDSTGHRAQSGTGFGGSIGLSMPFKATGHISCWAVSLALMGNIYTWTDLNETLNGSTYTKVTPTLSAGTTQIALPIGIEYKVGNDAILTKRLAFGTSLGAGLMPQFNMTTLSSVSGESAHYAFGCTPFVKAEGSFFIGFDLKVRITYSIGDIMLTDINHAIATPMTDGAFRITSNGNLMLSLVIMPFSGGWRETSWWNTYDTYNEHDRLN